MVDKGVKGSSGAWHPTHGGVPGTVLQASTLSYPNTPDMPDILGKHQPDFQNVVDFLKSDIAALRTGRANPAMVENVMVEAYGGTSPLVGLAALSSPDGRTILIQPWDRSLLKSIEKGIIEADLNINPVVQGDGIRLTLPSLTEESRKALVKVLGEKLEQARVGVRNVREQARIDILTQERDKNITEDEKYKLLEQLDKVAAGYNERIKHIGAEKETEIMTI